jgi:hypothetical protein
MAGDWKALILRQRLGITKSDTVSEGKEGGADKACPMKIG